MPWTVLAACALAAARHSSPVFHKTFQVGLRGAAIIFCISGLTSVGTGRVVAGTCKGASAPPLVWAVPLAPAKVVHASTRSLMKFIHDFLSCWFNYSSWRLQD